MVLLVFCDKVIHTYDVHVRGEGVIKVLSFIEYMKMGKPKGKYINDHGH